VRILIVEDEAKVARAIQEGLTAEQYECAVAHTGEEAFFRLSAEPFDLVLLDLMLPGRDGLEILAAMRRQGLDLPVLVLTARDTVEDRVRGLDSGADDYLTKPFAFPELVARLRALSRRGRSDQTLKLSAADLEMDVAGRTARRAGEDLDLTQREFALLEYLLRNQGRIVSREMLARDVWQETGRATPLDNVIDVHIARLRKKVDQGSAQKLIHTVRGVGFIIKTGEAA
jgi:DNA-binding response OmpR family regulator